MLLQDQLLYYVLFCFLCNFLIIGSMNANIKLTATKTMIFNSYFFDTLRFILKQSNCITIINLSTNDSEFLQEMLASSYFNGTIVLTDSTGSCSYDTAFFRPIGINYCETLDEDFIIISPSVSNVYAYFKFPAEMIWYNNKANIVLVLTGSENASDITRLQSYFWGKLMILNCPIFIKGDILAVFDPFLNVTNYFPIDNQILAQTLKNSEKNMHGSIFKLFVFETSDKLYEYKYTDIMYWQVLAEFSNFTIELVRFPQHELDRLETLIHIRTIHAGLCFKVTIRNLFTFEKASSVE